MTTSDAHEVTEMLGSVFAERPLPAFDAETRTTRRHQAVSHIQHVLGDAHPRQRATVRSIRWGETLAVVAMAASLAIVVGKIWPDTAHTPPKAAFRAIDAKGRILCDRNDGRSWTDCEPAKEASFVALRTLENARVVVEAPSGVRAILDASSTLLMTEGASDVVASRVTLTEGTLDVTVPKLGPNSRFSVVTPSATITVFGTAFSVEVRKPINQPSNTCVRLREGIVMVSSDGREDRLTAPAVWGCGSRGESAAGDQPGVAPTVAQPRARETALQANPDGTRRVNMDRSTLLAETKLLQRALGAERRNDLTTADKSLRQLITLYPNSVVTPEARAALDRIANKQTSQQRE